MLLYGFLGILGFVLTAFLALVVLALLFGPTAEDIDEVMKATEATWPESRVYNIIVHLEEKTGRHWSVGGVYGILELLENEGVVISIRHEDPTRTYKGRPRTYLTWKVVSKRPKKERKGAGSTVSLPVGAMPVPA